MPRRGRKKSIRLRLKSDTIKSILSVCLIVAGGIGLVSFFAPEYSVNSKIQEVLKTVFGWSSFIIPEILIIWGLLYVRAIKWRFVDVRVLFGLTGLLFALSGLFHVPYLRDGIKRAQSGAGGGIVGYKILQILESTFSVYGAVLLLLAVVGISFIFIFNISIDDMLEFLADKFSFLKALRKKKSKKTEELRISTGISESDSDMPEVEEGSKESFEIVPSMSEPQRSKVSGDESFGKVSAPSIAIESRLPYADRVWENPPLDLLNDPANTPVDRGDVKTRAKIIEDALESFGISAKVTEVNFGPSVTQYALETSSGTKIAKISSLQYDLALALASPTGSVRIEAPIPGRSLIGIEVPNTSPVIVNFKSVLTSDAMRSLKSKLGIVLGSDVSGSSRVYDIAKMPHLLIAGATGSGKSVFLHSIIFSLLYRCSPAECKFIMVDPKRVELVHYQEIPHLLTPVVTDTDKAPAALRWAVAEMERRYKLFENAKARNIESYNEKSGFQALPYIIIMVEELGEIMVADPAEVEKCIIRLAQLSRATGIHLVLTVQRPSTNVITGLIKANIPCRVAFNVASQIDSRVIIDQPGAEKLLGKGDMLFVPPDASKPIRIQGAMVADKEISQLVSYLKSAGVEPDYRDEILRASESTRSVSLGGGTTDALFDEAVEIVLTSGKASASLLQRRLSIGYARAARILDELEAKGIVSGARGSKPRDVLSTNDLSPLSSIDPE